MGEIVSTLRLKEWIHIHRCAKFDIWVICQIWHMTASLEYHSPPTSERSAPLFAMEKNSICIYAQPFTKTQTLGAWKYGPFFTLGVSWKMTTDPDWPWLVENWKMLNFWQYLIITEVCKSKRKNLCDPKLTNMRATLVTMSGIENCCSIFAITFTFLSLTVITFTFHRNYFHFSKVSLSLFIVRNQVSANLPVVSSLSLIYSNHFHVFLH